MCVCVFVCVCVWVIIVITHGTNDTKFTQISISIFHTNNKIIDHIFILKTLLKNSELDKKNCVILRHDDEAAETYVPECDAVWSGIEILPVCRKEKPLSPASGEIKHQPPLTYLLHGAESFLRS